MPLQDRLRSALAVVGTVVLLLGVAGCAGETESRAAAPAPTATAPSASPSAPPGFGRYVALGDSYTAAPLVPTTDVANGCFRSSSNYPALVARALGARLDDRSCGGATTADLARSQFPGVPAQLAALNADTDLVTLGIGGNDGRVFTRLTGQCPAVRSQDPTGSPCAAYMSRGGRDALLTALKATGTRITAAVEEIQRRAPDAKILLVGYPQIADADDACRELPLATGDYAYAVKVNRALTDLLRDAARATGTTYVDVWRASRGHDICSADPWINGSVTDQQRAARYHPFAVEQQAVAGLVTRALGR